ncbi:DUF3578 domain-containing protein [Paenibacillus polygoni]|uniref:DUF3578 domain-containing protein n=1 Tax=Paenibacillus polygoni TaxID=3050112 RepID=A0ABY8X6L8_9BACL|nr:DUF3578 domain-containing protein [Paenibacillus polygoni]WIV19091.1 DUF3578 domain-containing protein [Paenibacillus polygoni]
MLPEALSNIFRAKQKSYKMVLILSIIELYQRTHSYQASIDQIAQKFLAYFQQESEAGNTVDTPPEQKASGWNEFTLSQTKGLLKTPIEALSAILNFDQANQTLTLVNPEWFNEETLKELKEYAMEELNKYNKKLELSREQPSFSLHNALSQIMNTYLQAKTEPFTQHPLGILVRKTIPNKLMDLLSLGNEYLIEGSTGKGKWADIPWIAVMDRRITKTTQRGEYIVYLFSIDMKAVYLTLAQGVKNPPKDGYTKKYEYLKKKTDEIRNLIPLEGLHKDENIFLTDRSGLGRDYQVSTVAYIKYERDDLPEDDELIQDLRNLVSNYNQYVDIVLHSREELTSDKEPNPVTLTVKEQLEQVKRYIHHKGFLYPDGLLENFYLSLKSKPFVILAGVSGTGKTKLVKLFAEALGATMDNGQFTLIPVRPDWSDPSDLLGYKDLAGIFRPGRLTEVLVEASKRENKDKPYFICLDEMNLARVEYYFSDILSVMETQEWNSDRIITSPLIGSESLREEDQPLYGGVSLPDNVYVIGTVNMDETTHPFSKKVLDRANTIEFNYINLEQYPDYVEEEGFASPAVNNLFLRSDYLQLSDVYSTYQDLVHSTTDKLVRINDILEEIHSHVGFRIRDSICFYMVYNQRFDLMPHDKAFDGQLLQKILPRIQGSSLSVKRVLLQLMQEALGKSIPIKDLLDDASDLYGKYGRKQQDGDVKYPLSARKIAFMLRRLEEDGFTSYWLS